MSSPTPGPAAAPPAGGSVGRLVALGCALAMGGGLLVAGVGVAAYAYLQLSDGADPSHLFDLEDEPADIASRDLDEDGVPDGAAPVDDGGEAAPAGDEGATPEGGAKGPGGTAAEGGAPPADGAAAGAEGAPAEAATEGEAAEASNKAGRDCSDGRVKQRADGTYEIQESTLEYYALHPAEGEKLGEFWWAKGRDGQVRGVRLGKLPCPGLMRGAGMMPGDVLLSVNGQTPTSISKGISIWRDVKKSNRATLVVQRKKGGGKKTLKYIITD